MTKQRRHCPCCKGNAQTHSIPTWTDDGIQYTYFLSCLDCGYGPSIAHDTEAEAIACWNEQETEKNTN